MPAKLGRGEVTDFCSAAARRGEDHDPHTYLAASAKVVAHWRSRIEDLLQAEAEIRRRALATAVCSIKANRAFSTRSQRLYTLPTSIKKESICLGRSARLTVLARSAHTPACSPAAAAHHPTSHLTVQLRLHLRLAPQQPHQLALQRHALRALLEAK